MDARLAVMAYLQVESGMSVTRFCAEQGISRQSFYVLKRRFEAEGVEGMLPRSRRPRSSPTALPASVIATVIELRHSLAEQGWDNGALSIHHWMARQGPAPSARSIHRILVAHGLIEPQPKKRPRRSHRRFQMSRPNECWQIDGHWRSLADGTAFTVLRVQDDCSRQVMASLAAWTENTEDAWACVRIACERHGAPAIFLSDNGTAFSHRRARGQMNQFEARLRAAGILPITSSVAHPQTCGKKEREWRTLDRWLDARPAPESLEEAQKLLDVYDWLFNNDRPHQSLDGRTPAETFKAGEKATAATSPLAGPMTLQNVRVKNNGVVRLGGNYEISIGTSWAGAHVTVLREDPACAIVHGHELIDFIHIDPDRRYQLRPRR